MVTTIPFGQRWPQRKPATVRILGTKEQLPASIAPFMGHAQIGGLDFVYFEDDADPDFPGIDADYNDLSYEICYLNIPDDFQNVRYANDPWSDEDIQLVVDAQPLAGNLIVPVLVNLYRTRSSTRSGSTVPSAVSLSRFAATAGHFCSNGLEHAGKVFCAQPSIYGSSSAKIKVLYYGRGIFLPETETLYRYFLPLRLPNQSAIYYAMTDETVQPTLRIWYNQLKSGSGHEPFFVGVDDVYGIDPLEILITTQAKLVISEAG